MLVTFIDDIDRSHGDGISVVLFTLGAGLYIWPQRSMPPYATLTGGWRDGSLPTAFAVACAQYFQAPVLKVDGGLLLYTQAKRPFYRREHYAKAQ